MILKRKQDECIPVLIKSFDFRRYCLFCPDVFICMLPHEYDAKVPQQYIIPASIVTTGMMANGKKTLLGLCHNRGDKLRKIFHEHIIGAPSLG